MDGPLKLKISEEHATPEHATPFMLQSRARSSAGAHTGPSAASVNFNFSQFQAIKINAQKTAVQSTKESVQCWLTLQER
jgi:hypothetical protein